MNPTVALIEPEVLELIRSRSFVELRETLHGLQQADVADILADVDPKEAAIAFRVLPRDDAGQVFAYLQREQQERLIAALGDADSVSLVEAMSPDDRARLLDELPPEVATRIVASLSPEERKSTQAILGYPPRSVGRLMTPDYVRIRPEWTVARALEHIRRYGRDAETINVVYVIDQEWRLIDDLRLRALIMADPDQTVESLMNQEYIALRADQPQEEAVLALTKYDRVALPVVDSRGVLLGIVTHDDVADVAQREATEDIQKLGGVAALESPYSETGHLTMFSKRGPWLALLLVGQSITIVVLGSFQERLAEAVVLTLFMPLVMSCGGNSGSQASTLINRALTLGEVRPKDWLRIVAREIVIGLLLGAMLGAMGFSCVLLFTKLGHAATAFPMQLAATVGLAIVCIVVWGVTLGSVLPLALRRLGLDPATASAPMVATLMDASGTLIYLGFAVGLLTGTVLPASS